MPQIAQLSETYASQVFWILVFFGLIFFVIGRGMVPKVMDTVTVRDTQIASDLAAADAARKAADVEEEAWRTHSAEQRSEAQAIIAKSKSDASKAAEVRLSALKESLDARMVEADARIAAARDSAMTEIENVASEAASAIVARVAGIQVDQQAAQAAVKETLHG